MPSMAAQLMPDSNIVKTEIDFDFDTLLDGVSVVASTAVSSTLTATSTPTASMGVAAAAAATNTTTPLAATITTSSSSSLTPSALSSTSGASRFFGIHRQPPQQNATLHTTTTATTANSDDAKLQNLLQEFDLEILYTTLKLGCITYRSLRYLSTDDINAAIHHIGYRAEFREKLFAWRNEKLPPIESPTLNVTPMTMVHRPVTAVTATTAASLPPALASMATTTTTTATTTTATTTTTMTTIPSAITAITNSTTTLARPKVQMPSLAAMVLPSPPSAIVQPERRAPVVASVNSNTERPPIHTQNLITTAAGSSGPSLISTVTHSSPGTIAEDFLVLFDQSRNFEQALSMNLLSGMNGVNSVHNNTSNNMSNSNPSGMEQPSTSAAAAAAAAATTSGTATAMPFGRHLRATSGGNNNNTTENNNNNNNNFVVQPTLVKSGTGGDTLNGVSTHLPKGILTMSCSKVNVYNLLCSSHIGRTIRQWYDKNGYLTNEQRNEIVRLVVESVMQQGQSLCPNDFRAILKDIVTVFPTERMAVDYYFIYRTGKGNPLGRLYQRYSNENCKRRRFTRLATITPAMSGGGSSHTNTDEDEVNSDAAPCGVGEGSNNDMDEEDSLSAYPEELPGNVPAVDEMTALALKQLLTTDHFSWEEVCDKWIQTWALRQKEQQQSNLSELLTHWAKLSDPRAAELFKIDFRHVYPGKENCLFAKWDEFVRKLTPIFDKKINYEDMKKLYKYSKMGLATKDEIDFIYAMGLTALMPSVSRSRDQSGKLRVRAGIVAAFESFVMRLNSLEAYESQLELYACRYGVINRTTHPFLVVVTPNEPKITKIYVALENRFYCMKSFLHALDLCYKIYHTCGLKYPTVCENVWTFIQRFFYDMHVPWEARNANLVALLVSLTTQS